MPQHIYRSSAAEKGKPVSKSIHVQHVYIASDIFIVSSTDFGLVRHSLSYSKNINSVDTLPDFLALTYVPHTY